MLDFPQIMARIFPFQPYRYSHTAGPLGGLVTQPYDKITPEMQARYLQQSPHNLVRVILGQRFDSDSNGNNVYTASSSANLSRACFLISRSSKTPIRVSGWCARA